MLFLLILFIGSILFVRKGAPHAGDFGFGMASMLAFVITVQLFSTRAGQFMGGCILPPVVCIYILFDFISHDAKTRVMGLFVWCKTHWQVLVYSCAGMLFFGYVMEWRDLLPRGTDCVHHAIISQKILNTFALCPDWEPFAATQVQYPQGMHVLLAALATIFHCAIPKAEQILQTALYVPSALLIGGLGAKLFKSKAAGWFAGLTFVFLGNAGTFFSMWAWAGYPSMIGFLLFSALVWYALLPQPMIRDHAAAILLWTSFALTHHMTLLTSLVVLPGWAVIYFATHTTLTRRALIRMFGTGIPAAVLAILVNPRLIQIHSSGDTFHLTSDPMTTALHMLELLGLPLAGAVFGMVYAKKTLKSKPEKAALGLMLAWFLCPFLCFLITEYGIRLYTLYFCEEEFTWFAPTRFLAASAIPLSIFSGGAFVLLIKRFGNPRRVMYLLSVLVMVVGMVRYAIEFPSQPKQDDTIRLAEEVKKFTPENAFLLYDSENLPDPLWLPVLSWRACVLAPLPASEDRTEMRRTYHLFSKSDYKNESDLEKIRKYLSGRGLEPWFVYIDEEGIARIWKVNFQAM